MGVRDGLLRLAGRVQRVQLWLAAVALVTLMMVTVVDVFMRYLFNRPIRGSFDAVEGMLLIFVFNSMAATFSAGATSSSISIDLFVPRRAARH